MKRHLNLIPQSVRRKQLIIRRLRYWLPIWGIALVLGGSLLNTQHRSLVESRLVTAKLDDECEAVRKLAAANLQTQTEVTLLQQQARWLRSLEQSQVPLITLAAITQSAAALAGKVQLDRFQFLAVEATSPKPPASGTEAPPVPLPVSIDDRIDLTGTAIGDSAVSSLIARLEATNLFTGVELVALQALGIERQFQIRCVLRASSEHLAVLEALPTRQAAISQKRHVGKDTRF